VLIFTISVVALAFLIPIVLEQSVESISFELGDHSKPCRAITEDTHCEFQWGGTWIDTTAYSFYVNSVGVAAQALILIGMGSLADHGSARKSMMLSFGLLGGISTLCYMFVKDPSLFWVIALLSIFSNICFGTSWVFYNAYLPVLTKHQPKVKKAYREDPSNVSMISDKTANKLSANAFGYGYSGGILALLCTVGILFSLDGDKMTKLLYAISFTGAWWLVFMLISVVYLKPRPGPPLPKGQSFFIYSYKRVYYTFKKATKFAEIMKYLAAWLLLSDSVNTIIVVAVLFAKTVLGASIETLISLCGLVPLSAIFGACNLFIV
jgi:UMF1 family MFS transporter